MKKKTTWPVLKHYDSDHLARIALPLGGIGTGTVSLGGRGDLNHWEIVNRPAKGFNPAGVGGPAFFCLRAKASGEDAVTRLLEGPLESFEYEGASGSAAPWHGLPRFRDCSFSAAYPFGQVHLKDNDVPLAVDIEAFNPLVPGDPEVSGIPVAVLRFVLTNRTTRRVAASLCGSLPNFIGADGSSHNTVWGGQPVAAGMKKNRNRFRRRKNLAGLFMDSKGVNPQAEQWGTMALTTTAKTRISYRTRWNNDRWGGARLDFWDDFTEDGRLEPGTEQSDNPTASLAVEVTVPPKSTRDVTFLLTWHFPNRQTWTPKPAEDCCCADKCVEHNTIGNYYTTQYKDAWDVAARVAADLPQLEQRTLQFVNAFCRSDLPDVVKEAALFNLSTLRSQTCFRTPDGHFFGFEGCCDGRGCCHGSCTHVWNYEQATAFLFGSLSRSMRNIEFLHATRDNGLMSFRVNLPLERAAEMSCAAADGQLGCIMKIYRDWQLCGDDDWLRKLWPKVKKAVEFCWIENGWDADKDGVMEGCQHNTMDVEYYGPNPQMGAWYLGALRAAEEMARYVGDADFAADCRGLFDNGSKWLDANLFNGDYYEHRIRPAPGKDAVAPGLQMRMGAEDATKPVLQLGPGCLVDQLVGQYMADVCGLGKLLKRSHIRKTLRSIRKYNYRRSFHDHFNNMRSYVLGDEAALLMATYPHGGRPKQPFPYFNEVMTGFEYTAAVHMLYEGMEKQGLEHIQDIRNRYDGRKRSPFDEAECGHHYARAMASWAAVPALTGFRYSAVTATMTFAARPGTHFWSTGDAWGTCTLTALQTGMKAELKVICGRLALQEFVIDGVGRTSFRARRVRAGKQVSAVVTAE